MRIQNLKPKVYYGVVDGGVIKSIIMLIIYKGENLMKKEELDQLIAADPYHQERKAPTEWELRLYLREVDYHCPLCGKELQSRKQKKPSQKKFQIAHIYPNRPTVEQYNELHSLERIGTDSETFENKIALCIECHATQDYHTTQSEYLKLLRIKERCLNQTALHDATLTLGLEDEIEIIVEKLTHLTADDLTELCYEPVSIAKKFEKSELPLQSRIQGYVYSYYPFIRETLRNMDGKNNFNLDILSGQIKSCFKKMNSITQDKSMIFSKMVEWIKNKTKAQSYEACEAIVSFFVQNCEVFYEITE